MNLLIVGIILALSVGLVYISYRIYSEKIFNIYTKQGEHAVHAAVGMVSSDIVENFRKEIMSEEFRKIRAEALAADDENIIREWMHTRPSFFDTFGVFYDPDKLPDNLTDEKQSLYIDYENVLAWLDEIINLFDIKIAYLQFIDDDKIINLADPGKDLFDIGTIEEQSETLNLRIWSICPAPFIKQKMAGCALPITCLWKPIPEQPPGS
jgi:hypothetical protein